MNNDPNAIMQILQRQRNTKVKEIENLERKVHALEDEIQTIDQLTQLSLPELEKFANVLSQVNSMQACSMPPYDHTNSNFQTQSASQQPKTVLEAVQNKEQQINQNVNPPKKNGLGFVKKKDKNDKTKTEDVFNKYSNNNYVNYYDDENNWQ